jgi:hypothetical protein
LPGQSRLGFDIQKQKEEEEERRRPVFVSSCSSEDIDAPRKVFQLVHASTVRYDAFFLISHIGIITLDPFGWIGNSGAT